MTSNFFTAGSFQLFRIEYPPGYHMPTHRDQIPRISIITRGAVREVIGGRDELGTSASVVVKPESVSHSNAFGPDGAELLSLVLPARPGGGVWNELRWFHGGPVTFAATRLVAALRGAQCDPDIIDDLVYQLVDRVDAPDDNAGRAQPPLWLERIRHQLEDEFAAQCSVSVFAEAAQVHPVHLTRLFRRHYQCSVMGYVRRLRVRAAANALASTEASLAALAIDAGFADQSHLCRIFKADMGITPGRYRSLMQAH
jgi:AraC family transcriptional regulator